MELIQNRDEPDSTDVLVLQAPPRHGKSELTSKYLPSWYLGRHPDHRVMLNSYADHLSRSFGRKCRDVLDQRKAWFNIQGVRSDVKAANEWDLRGFEGGMLASGVGGPLTGRGANLLIIDDPIKNAEQAVSDTIRENQWDWFQSTAWTRLEPGGICVVMMTRWHEDDLVGKLLKLGKESLGLKVREVVLPAVCNSPNDMLGRKIGEALWKERWPLESLMKRKRALEEYWWQALFQQKPGQHGRTAWPADHFEDPFWVSNEEWPDRFEFSTIAVDPSKGRDTGDYTGIVFLGLARGLIWVTSIVQRLTTAELCRQTIKFWREEGGDRVGLEANSFQDLLAPEIERCQRIMNCPPLPISLITNTTNKQLRIERLGPYLGRHAFRFLKNADNERLVKQLKGFPMADHDDGPDAMEMSLRLLNHVARLSQ